MGFKILFTGGHYNSAVSTIDWLKKAEPSIKFVWVGKKYVSVIGKKVTPEFLEVKKRNIPFYHIQAGKLFRTTSVQYVPQILLNLILIPVGFVQSFLILVKERPDLIVSFGGFIALPIVICGKFFRIKSVTHEQTVILGLANRIISKVVSHIYTSWPVDLYDVDKSYKKKMIYTGLPLSEALLNQKKKITFDNNGLPVIYVTGGKSGAGFINDIVMKSLENLVEIANVIWSFGSAISDDVFHKAQDKVEKISRKSIGKVLLKKYLYEDDLGSVYASCDIIICRGGAHTVYEIAVLQKYAIIIPIPWVSYNEQYLNAQVLKNAGYAYILDQEKTSPYMLQVSVAKLLEKAKQRPSYKKSVLVTKSGQENLGNEILKTLKK